jgi:hypothetical protein
MTLKQVNKLPDRIKQFKKIRADAQEEFLKVNKIIGVLRGTSISEIAHIDLDIFVPILQEIGTV